MTSEIKKVYGVWNKERKVYSNSGGFVEGTFFLYEKLDEAEIERTSLCFPGNYEIHVLSIERVIEEKTKLQICGVTG